MGRSDWEILYLRKKHLSLMLVTAITAEGKNKWLKSSIIPDGIKRWCCIRHFETQSNHTSFWGVQYHSEHIHWVGAKVHVTRCVDLYSGQILVFSMTLMTVCVLSSV